VLIDKAGIARLLPHSGAMCLLDGVLNWDEMRIRCATTSHRAADNPMRRGGKLGILCGVEYAAQAMALHGGLAGGKPAGGRREAAGFLASVRSLACHVDRLDVLQGPIIVAAERLHGEAGRAIYSFLLQHADRTLLSGKAAVVLQAVGA
jgi:predicted hotdog family 3-hydroxylacyl-ACP dehydratase